MTTPARPFGAIACAQDPFVSHAGTFDLAFKVVTDVISSCGQYGNRAIIGIMAHAITSHPSTPLCCAPAGYALYLSAAAWRTALAGESS